MKNVINKIVTVLSGISVKSNQIQQALQTVMMTNQQYQVVNTLCDQISARYFIVKDPLSDIAYLFKCQIGNVIYEGDQLDIQEDIIVWDKPVPNDGTQTTITIIDDYQGPINYKWAYGIQQNKNIYLDLNGHVLAYLPIYNKGQLTIIDSYGEEYIVIKDGNYIINEGRFCIDSGILDNIRNIDNSGILILNGGCIKNSNLICLSGSTFIMNGGSIENCQLTIQNIKEFDITGGIVFNSKIIIQNSQIQLYYTQYFQNNQIHLKQGGSFLLDSGYLAIDYEWFEANTISLYLYGNKKYDYNQFVREGYSKPRFDVVYCCQGATLENYSGTIKYI